MSYYRDNSIHLCDVHFHRHIVATVKKICCQNVNDVIVYMMILILYPHVLSRSEPLLINQAGETAEDVAGQYRNLEICITIRTANKSKAKSDSVNFFSHSPLYRCAEYRSNKEWLGSIMRTSNAKFVLYNNLQPLVRENPDKSINIYKLLFSDVEDFISCGALVVFLGADSLMEADEILKGQQYDENINVFFNFIQC